MSPPTSQKNETVIFVLAFIITASILSLILWRLFPNIFENDLKDNPPQNFAQVENVPKGLFNYGGSTTWAPIRKEVDTAISIVWPEFKLRYTHPIVGKPGSGTGIKMLLDNQLAFAQSSRSLKPEEYQQARDRGFSVQEFPVALDGIVIVVAHQQNIAGLTLSDLKNIYTGKITNWSQVGGKNQPITPYSRGLQAGGTVDFFVENLLNKEDFGTNVKFVDTTTQALQKMAKDKGGIYYATASEVITQCTVKALAIGETMNQYVSPYQMPFIPPEQCPERRNNLNKSAFQTGDYPLTRRLFVIIKLNGQEDEKAGIAYKNLLLTNQGQESLEKAQFIRIR